MDAPPSDFSLLHWSSEDAPMRARLDAWRDLVTRKLLPLDVQPLRDDPLLVKVQLRALPGLRFAWGAVDASINRCTQEAAAGSDDDVMLVVNRDDRLVAEQRGREVTLGSGDATFMACTDASMLGRPNYGRVLCVRIPRENLRALVPHLDDRTVRPISAGTGALRLLENYCGVMGDKDALATAPLRETVVRHIHDLTALVLNPCRENFALTEAGGVRAARLRAAKSFVLSNLHSRTLSVGSVAAYIGVTPRYVQKLFETEGTTYSEFALIARLERAFSILTDPRERHRTISDIAFDSGFSDISNFNHAFRRRFQTSPSDVRNRKPLSPHAM